MESEPPHAKRPRKRAPRCKELDNPLIRKEIEFRYGVEGRKLDDVVEEINRAYGLKATKYQYRDRLNKWGCRQRLNHGEYEEVHRAISAREALQMKSKVILNGITEIPERRLQRWISRNTTFTGQLFSKVGQISPSRSNTELQVTSKMPNRSKTLELVRTPSPNPETYLLPVIKKTISVYYPHTPIGRLQSYLEQTLPEYLRNSHDSSSALNQVDKHGFRVHFRKLLSIESPSILATCSALALFFYLRKDDENFKFVVDRYPHLNRGLYYYIHECTKDNRARDCKPRPKHLPQRDERDIVSEISKANLAPQSVEEAYDLLVACKCILGDLGVFYRLWDPQKISAREIDSYSGGKGLFARLEDAPLHSKTPALLKALLRCGFSRYKFVIFFRAIILGDWSRIQVLCENLGIELLASNPGAELPRNENAAYKCIGLTAHSYSEPTNFWEFVDKAVFYRILVKYGADIFLSLIFSRHKSQRKVGGGPKILALAHASCVNPRFTRYAVEIIQWKFSISAKEAALMMMDGISFIDYSKDPNNTISKHGFGLNAFGSTDLDPVSAIEELFSFGIDPNETRLWNISIWEELVLLDMRHYERNSEQKTTRNIFKKLLDYGAALDQELKRDRESIQRSYVYAIFLEENVLIEYLKTNMPLTIAFGLADKWTFCLLMERLTTPHRVCDWVASEDSSGIHPEFIRALQDQNRELVEKLWEDRTFDLGVMAALEKSDVSTAKNIILTYSRQLQLDSLFLRVVKFYERIQGPLPICGYEILTLLLDLLEGSLYQSTRDCGFGYAVFCQPYLHDAIKRSDVQLLKLLIDFYFTQSRTMDPQIKGPERCRQLYKDGAFLLDSAAQSSLVCLKYLISQGSHIDEFRKWGSYSDKVDPTLSEAGSETNLTRTHSMIRTALFGAIIGGNMENISYVLSEGANIYAPCGYKSSAVEFAISEGRIDALALILEAVPNSYPLALGLAESPRYKDEYTAQYVRDWKPADLSTSAPPWSGYETSTSGDGRLIDVTEQGLGIDPTMVVDV
ncbi:hypothetical protein TWF481_006119 [Arthrobotrys musiformis]|uniref:Clr5 domain-containing protein n=1 Tax=Arthrobotrys musiformis TaxID=47236 RepID=A0AAV9WGY8_9PEZI